MCYQHNNLDVLVQEIFACHWYGMLFYHILFHSIHKRYCVVDAEIGKDVMIYCNYESVVSLFSLVFSLLAFKNTTFYRRLNHKAISLSVFLITRNAEPLV